MSRHNLIIHAVLACALAFASVARAETVTAALRADGLTISDDAGRVMIDAAMTQAVPWRVFTLDQPARLVLEFSELEWNQEPIVSSDSITAVRAGRHRPGWSRMVAVLREPLAVDTADMRLTDEGFANLEIVLRPTTAEEFRSTVAPPLTSHSDAPPPLKSPSGNLLIAIDPGHGGIDPGAEAEGMVESDLMLVFANQLKAELIEAGRFDVILTRTEDVFVPLEHRMTIARASGADIFVSLHADALEAEAGSASGMTVYTLAEEVTDLAAIQLAERHASNDILAGVDLRGTEDEIAIVLLDLARRETMPRSEALADALVEGFEAHDLAVNSRPHRHGGFAVLRAAEMPSVLVELGFLSSSEDRARLTSADWTASAVRAISSALSLWADADALRRRERSE